jgi:uncharacterized protein
VSYSIDVNLLLYASDQASPRHAAALQQPERRALDPDLLYVAWPPVMGYLRITTHPRIFSQPLSPAPSDCRARDLTRSTPPQRREPLSQRIAR